MLTNMGLEFNHVRETKGYIAALKKYQQRLNEFGGTLADIMSPKDIMDKILDIEKELRSLSSSGSSGTGSALDEVRHFLGSTVH